MRKTLFLDNIGSLSPRTSTSNAHMVFFVHTTRWTCQNSVVFSEKLNRSVVGRKQHATWKPNFFCSSENSMKEPGRAFGVWFRQQIIEKQSELLERAIRKNRMIERNVEKDEGRYLYLSTHGVFKLVRVISLMMHNSWYAQRVFTCSRIASHVDTIFLIM